MRRSWRKGRGEIEEHRRNDLSVFHIKGDSTLKL